MPRQLTFIHAADLHIGAPFRGVREASSVWADRLVSAIPEAFDRIVDVACERNVDFVIIAGDVFDEARASFPDYVHFFEGVEKLGEHGIPVYLCTGNHDPLSLWRQDFYALPENAVMLSADQAQFELFERDGEPLCVLGGRGILNSVSRQDIAIAEGITRDAANEALGERATRAPFGVGILHTGLDWDQKSAPRALPQDLYDAGFDYWALGHIHKRYVDSEENPRLSFSGDIQGRDIKETGRRGVNLVTLTEGAANHVEFIPTSSVAWEQIDVNVESCANIADIVKTIRKAQFDVDAQDQCEKMISRVTLTGTTRLHDALLEPGVLEDIRTTVNDMYEDFLIDALIDKTTSPIDLEALRSEGLFPATFLRAADDVRAHEEESLSYLQEQLKEKGISIASADAALSDIDELGEEAENLVLDLLMHEVA